MRNGSIMRGRDRSVRISSGQKYAPKAHLQARKRPFLLHNGEDVPVVVNELILLPNGSHTTQLRASSVSCPRRSKSVPASRKVREYRNDMREEKDIRYENYTDAFYEEDEEDEDKLLIVDNKHDVFPPHTTVCSNNSHMERIQSGKVWTRSNSSSKRKLSPLRHESGRLQFVRKLRSSQKRRGGGGSSRRRCKSVPSRVVKPYVNYSMKDFEDAYRYGIQSRLYKKSKRKTPSPPSPRVEKTTPITKKEPLLESSKSPVKKEKPKPKLRPWQKKLNRNDKKTTVEKQKHARSISPNDAHAREVSYKKTESRLVKTDSVNIPDVRAKEEIIINPPISLKTPPRREATPSPERPSSPPHGQSRQKKKSVKLSLYFRSRATRKEQEHESLLLLLPLHSSSRDMNTFYRHFLHSRESNNMFHPNNSSTNIILHNKKITLSNRNSNPVIFPMHFVMHILLLLLPPKFHHHSPCLTKEDSPILNRLRRPGFIPSTTIHIPQVLLPTILHPFTKISRTNPFSNNSPRIGMNRNVRVPQRSFNHHTILPRKCSSNNPKENSSSHRLKNWTVYLIPKGPLLS